MHYVDHLSGEYPMITISLCIIVKNEEDTLGKCLESVAGIVDEIIIIDTGSTDKTKEIAKNYTSNIYDFVWIDDFSAARNYSFSKATKEYILWLDADDVLLEEDRVKLIKLKRELSHNVDVVIMKYDYLFDEWGNVVFSHFRERLLKRSKGFRWYDPVHEWIGYDGHIIYSDLCITHKKLHYNSARNLKILQRMAADGKLFSPRNIFYYACELQQNGYNEAAEIYFNKFLDSGRGSQGENIIACIDLVNYYISKQDTENILRTLHRCFAYDKTLAEVCCCLGYYYKILRDYAKAIFWFKRAAALGKANKPWIAVSHDYWGYLPYNELSICHYNIGDINKAIEYIHKAEEYKPEDSIVKYNKAFLQVAAGV
jgi:glycosyltransferase involved in cell wall biosynthesis